MVESPIHHPDAPLTRRAVFPHWVSERVRWSDTDMIGHVNNLAFAAYFETGRSLFLRHFTQGDAGSRALFLLGEMTIRFIGEAHWPAQIDAGTGVIAIGRSSLRVGQGLFNGERCVATSESTLVLLNEETRRSREIPSGVRTWLESNILCRMIA
jgi:acyl-CoA thioester hydrolase